jgi:23S rRNA (cytidine1920-2'-O)/16S rRNA (cytidine1409-2'-O)-methyltransferase
MSDDKKRLDIEIFERKLVESRRIAVDLIESGKVFVDSKQITKPSQKVSSGQKIEVTEIPKYVSRAGLKLEGALEDFNINPNGLIVLDVGSSTGGFTDCLLQKGVKKVYAVDVGNGQFKEKLKSDVRVVLMENTDIREVNGLPDEIDLVVVDVSFISLRLVLPKVFELVKVNGIVICLVKPQFEVGKDNVGKGGIVKDENQQKQVVEEIKFFAKTLGFDILGETKSKVVGQDGNQEYLLYLKK